MLTGLLDGRLKLDSLGLKANQPLPRLACVRIQWTPDTRSLQHLLYRLFDPTLQEKSSFAQQYPEIAASYRQQFDKIDLKDLITESDRAAMCEDDRAESHIGPNRTLVHDLFRKIEDAFFAASKKSTSSGKSGVVIVIDEMDQAKRAVGLGTLIKNSRFQFVIIGIGEAINDILDDHQSAERKFSDGQFLVESLTELEVRELFDKASQRATSFGVKLRFTDQFCNLVAQDFAGYPAQIQAFGLDMAKHYRARLQSGMDIVIDKQEYFSLLQLRETSTNRDIRAMNDLDAGVEHSVTRWELLKAMVKIRSTENIRWITVDKLRLKLPAKYHTKLRENLEILVKTGVLETAALNADTVNIASPAILCEINRRIRRAWDPKSRLNK
jgi:hypothetical protein